MCVLAHQFPNRAKALNLNGRAIGDLRVIVGGHNPSDVQAGQKMGLEMCQALLQEPDFSEALDAL